jgi:hypothetical protein
LSTPSWPDKDPDDILDYEIDWTAWLGGLSADTILTSTWIVPSGLTMNSSSNTDTTAKLWLSDGTDGETYLITNRITTSVGRTKDQTVKLRVREN